jgi:hypothetical protein
MSMSDPLVISSSSPLVAHGRRRRARILTHHRHTSPQPTTMEEIYNSPSASHDTSCTDTAMPASDPIFFFTSPVRTAPRPRRQAFVRVESSSPHSTAVHHGVFSQTPPSNQATLLGRASFESRSPSPVAQEEETNEVSSDYDAPNPVAANSTPSAGLMSSRQRIKPSRHLKTDLASSDCYTVDSELDHIMEEYKTPPPAPVDINDPYGKIHHFQC